MSYILDAIKKSEQERNGADVPTLDSAHHLDSMYVKAPKSKLNWPLLMVGAALLLCAALLTLNLMFNKGSGETANSGGALDVTQQQAAPIQPAQVPQQPGMAPPAQVAQQPVYGGGQQNQPGNYQQPPPNGYYAGGQNQNSYQGQQGGAVAYQEQPTVIRPNPNRAAAQQTYREDGFSQQNEQYEEDAYGSVATDTPDHVRDNLPAMSFSSHIYSSNPDDRRVIINGKMLTEGMSVTRGVYLSEITEDGVVVEMDGQYIDINVLSGWSL